MGDRQELAQVRSEVGFGTVRRSMGRPLEQHDPRRDQNTEDG